MNNVKRTPLLLLAILVFAACVYSQTTEITYQGQLQSSSMPANGSFDFEFALYDAGGSQIGPVHQRNGVTVSNGIFSVNLDFQSSFTGPSRFLEIRVRQSGGGAFTTLTPRQPVTSTPYSIKSLTADTAATAVNASNAADAAQLGGVSASQYLQTNGNGSGLTNLNASSVTTGTLANARLGQIPTANIADGAVTAPKIASGQVVKGITSGASTITDNVNFVGGTGISITPAGNTLTISSTGGSGVGVSGSVTPNSIPVWTSPTALGTSLIRQTASAVQLPNVVELASGANLDRITFGSPNGETGMTFSGGNRRADIRFSNGVGLRMVAGLGLGPPGDDNGIAVYPSGQVGIGGAFADAKLTVISAGTQTSAVTGSGSGTATGVWGTSSNGVGIRGKSIANKGVYGESESNVGVQGESQTSYGVYGRSNADIGVIGQSSSGDGVYGGSNSATGVYGVCSNPGCIAVAASGTSWFKGNTTPITAANAGSGTGVAIGSEPSAGYIYAFDYGAFQPRNLFINGTGGRVHIGPACTGSPDQVLSVCGNASKVGGGSWLVLSDERLKRINGRFRGGLAAVMKLQPLRYNYRADNPVGAASGDEHIGFSAQAVAKIIPEAVTTNEDGYRMINNDPIIWTMLNAIKEQQAQIERQRKQIEGQGRQIRSLMRVNNRRF